MSHQVFIRFSVFSYRIVAVSQFRGISLTLSANSVISYIYLCLTRQIQIKGQTLLKLMSL